MSVSLEALAMAGIDSNEWAMDAAEWERNEMEDDHVPPHVLADEDDEDKDDENVTSTAGNYKSPVVGFYGRGDGVRCISDILCSLSRSIEKRASNGLSSVRIMVKTILGFLMVMTMKILSAHRSKL